jgi:hypothetical protein
MTRRRTIRGVRALLTLAALSALIGLAVPGCGGGSTNDAASSSDKAATAPEQKPQGAEPAEHTPEGCLGDAGANAMSRPSPRVWRGAVSKGGYAITVRRFGSPAAAHGAVEAADVVAYQSNFFGVFGPAQELDDGSTAKVARCLGTL